MTAQVIDMLSALESRRVAIASALQASNDVNRMRANVKRSDAFVNDYEEKRKDADFQAAFGVPRAGCNVTPYDWPELVPGPWVMRNMGRRS